MSRPPRLPSHDYRSAGAYFITVCCRARRPILATVDDRRLVLTPLGRSVHETWDAIPVHFPGVALDRFVVMPDHIHGILFLPDSAGDPWVAPTPDIQAPGPNGSSRGSLGTVVGAFKSSCTRLARRRGLDRGSIWQAGFFERVVRNERELFELRRYVEQNPLRWLLRLGQV